MMPRVAALAAACLSLAAAAQSPPAAAPRTADDVLAVLERYAPDPTALARSRAILDAQPPRDADRRALAAFYRERGIEAARLGLVSRQIDDLRASMRYSDAIDEMLVVGLLGQAEMLGGQTLDALQTVRRSLHLFPLGGKAIDACARAARVYRALGELDLTREAVAKASNIYVIVARAEPVYHEVYSTYFEFARAELALAEGRYADAEDAYRVSLRSLEAWAVTRQTIARYSPWNAGSPQKVEIDFLERQAGLSEALLRQGKIAEAEVAAREALERMLRRSGRVSSYTGAAITTLATVVAERGRSADAARLARAAIDTLERAGALPESVLISQARRVLARALAAQQRWAEADAEFTRMQAGLDRDALLASRARRGDALWGLSLVRLGKPRAALPMLRELAARDEAHLGEQAYVAALTRGFYGLALAAAGERGAAAAQFERATPVLLEQVRTDRSSEAASGARAFQLNAVLESYLMLLADQARDGDPAAAAAAFRIADAARGSAVQRSLDSSAARASLGDARLVALAREEQDARQQVEALGETLERLFAAPPAQQLPGTIAEVQQALEKTRRSRAQLRARIRESFPRYADLVDPRPASLEEARAVLAEREALVSIYVADERTLVWALSGTGRTAFASVPLGRAELARIVHELRAGVDFTPRPLRRFPEYDTLLAHRLYQALLAPVEAGWRDAGQLLVVPHGPLAQLPFALLVTEPSRRAPDREAIFDGYREVAWLLKRAAIGHVPSVSSLVTLRSVAAPSAAPRPFIAFADPVFRRKEAGANRARWAYAYLPELPDSSDEVREIALALKADPRRDVFLGDEASEKNVKSANLGAYRVVMFATHGLVAGEIEGLAEPVLVLAAPRSEDPSEDGVLNVSEILDLKLNADWVVLSACNTASPDRERTEALSGFGKAFFYAGGRALLVSNWHVDTVSARLLTTGLFQRLAQAPRQTGIEALREATLALMNGAAGIDEDTAAVAYSYAHPMFWAPFSVVGDTRAAR